MLDEAAASHAPVGLPERENGDTQDNDCEGRGLRATEPRPLTKGST